MSFFSPIDYKLLQNLLAPDKSDESDDEDDRLPPAGIQKIGPGDIANRVKARPAKKVEDQPKNIEEWEENQLKDVEDSGWDTRKTPEYIIIYKQAVYTEDVFLQMNNKTGSTSSCEDMVVEIQLPEENMRIEEMKLIVKDNLIELETRLYKLNLPLANNVDPDKGKAEFDSDKKILKLTLRMVRELDYVNF